MSDAGVEISAAATAAAEVKDTPVVGRFRDLELTLPPKLPATVALDIAEMQAAEDDDSQQLGVLWRLLSGVLGKDQLRLVRNKVAADGDSFDNLGPLLTEFVEMIVGPYGLTPGESPASDTPSETTGA